MNDRKDEDFSDFLVRIHDELEEKGLDKKQ